MGYTAATPENIALGAGDVLVDTVDVGATSGDNGYEVNQTLTEPQINGVPGFLIGTQYITSQEAILRAGMPELTAATIALLVPSAEEDTPGTIDSSGVRRLPLDAYHDLELDVPGVTNLFRFLADNAINQGTAAWTGQDTGMMNPVGEWHSKWSATPGARSPWRIIVEALGS